MGVMVTAEYPVLIEYIHNDVVDHQVRDDFGLVDVYKISGIHIQNMVNKSWSLRLEDESGRVAQGNITPLMDVTLAIPGPQQPDSYPTMSGIAFVRS